MIRLAFYILIVLSPTLWAQAPSDPVRSSLDGDTAAMLDYWKPNCNRSINNATTEIILQQVEACLWQARMQLQLGTKPLEALHRGQDLLSELESEENTFRAESMRLQGDLLMLEMGVRGFLFQFKNGGRLLTLANQAYQLDPSNQQAKLLLAVVLDHTPAVAGGNRQQAVEWYRELQTGQQPELFYYANYHLCKLDSDDDHYCEKQARSALVDRQVTLNTINLDKE